MLFLDLSVQPSLQQGHQQNTRGMTTDVTGENEEVSEHGKATARRQGISGKKEQLELEEK